MGFNVTTFLFELINFVVLVWLLSRLLYRPLRHSIDQRQKALQARRALVEEREREIEKLQADYQARNETLELLRDDVVREATEQAEKERARLLEQAREDAGAERVRAQRLLESEREAAATWVREVAVAQSTQAAGQMLLELAPEAVDDALFSRLVAELDQRPELLRGAVSGEGEATPELEVTGAKLPPQERADALRHKVSELTGRAIGLTLREDPALVGGLVVRIGDRVFDASLAGQLELFRNRARELLDAAAR